MNEISIKDFKELSVFYKAIAINISTFVNYLTDECSHLMDPITDRQILMSGHYATLFGSKLFVSKELVALVATASFKVHLGPNVPLTYKDPGWSPIISIPEKDIIEKIGWQCYIEKMVNLNAFK